MRKILNLIFTVTIIFSALMLAPQLASAETEGNYTYTVSNGEATITDFSTDVSGELIIPDTLGGYPVTCIGESAFSGCINLTDITVPNSVIIIRKYAFYNCRSLNNITISDNVISIDSSIVSNTPYYWNYENGDENVLYIGNHLITSKQSISKCIIKTGTLTIADYAFYDRSALTEISIPSSVTNIGKYAFSNCTGLSNITIPENVSSICEYTFYGCTSLKDITIPNSVKSIDNFAFYGCSSLTNMVIPDNVTSIGEYAFFDCTALTDIAISNNITILSKGIFRDCKSLTQVTIPSSVKTIDKHAFLRCTALTDVIISDNLTNIIEYAFSDCAALTNITIPTGVTSIGADAFIGCPNLTIYGYENSTAQKYANENNIPFVILEETKYEYTINSLKMIDPSTTEELTSIPSSEFVVEVKLTNESSDNIDTLVVATYNTDGSVLSVTYMYGSIDIGESVSLGTLIKNPNNDIAKIKAFVWSKLGELKPLAKSVEITN